MDRFLPKALADAPARSADRIYEALVRRIVEGALKPGDRLVEEAIAGEFGVSRTPVREALQHLSITGLAERGARRAFVVRRMDLPMLEELFEAMAELEAACARLSAVRMTAAERQALAAFAEACERCALAGDPQGYATANARFHAALYEGAHNRTLGAAAQVLRVRTSPWRAAQFERARERLESSQAEHRRVLSAILAADGAAAEQAMRAHIAATTVVVRDLLGGSGGPAPIPRGRKTL